MKRVAGFLLAGFLILTTAPVWAQQAYLSGNIGFGYRPNSDISTSSSPFDNDPAFVVNGAIGVEIAPNIRVEGEIGLHLNTADQGGTSVDWTFRTLSFMGNAYFDMPLQSPMKPYIGIGVGFADVNLEGESGGFTSDDSDLVLAAQLMAGLSFEINPKTTLNFGYRYFTTTNPAFSFAGGFDTEYSSHDFLVGARFWF